MASNNNKDRGTDRETVNIDDRVCHYTRPERVGGVVDIHNGTALVAFDDGRRSWIATAMLDVVDVVDTVKRDADLDNLRQAIADMSRLVK